jgi:hypothetical protein
MCPGHLLLQLSESLRNNSSITSVNLSSNHIGTDGVQVGTDECKAMCCRLLLPQLGNSWHSVARMRCQQIPFPAGCIVL